MIRLKLQPTEGTLIWKSPTASRKINELQPFWSIAAESLSFCEMIPSIFENDNCDGLNSAITGSIHGRSCYLGFDKKEHRHYFAKGVGWTWSSGWEPKDGNSGIFPLWGAERERDISLHFTKLGISTSRPEAIFLHGLIPDSQGKRSYPADTIMDLDGTSAKPCMYVYSAPVRWRIADLSFLSDKKRDEVCSNATDKNDWLRSLLAKLGQSCRRLHDHGGYDYSLSSHNAFTDGTRIDFEYAVLPEYPHKEKQLNEDVETWKDKEIDGLREIAWYLADIMRLNVSGKELNKWWYDAYYGQNENTFITTQ